MAVPIWIGALDPAEAADLAHALAARGLVAVPVGADPHWLEVREAREETQRLLAEIRGAVTQWLAERDRASLELRVGGTVEEVPARRSLQADLAERAGEERSITRQKKRSMQPPSG